MAIRKSHKRRTVRRTKGGGKKTTYKTVRPSIVKRRKKRK